MGRHKSDTSIRAAREYMRSIHGKSGQVRKPASGSGRGGYERCPRCPTRMHEATNGNGRAYLECFSCGYVEAVRRRNPNAA